MSGPFDNLTDEQRTAVIADGNTVSVAAGPGSGKTKVLSARCAYLIDSGVDPTQILCLTFTRSAAANIREQVRAACGRDVQAMTFHGFAARNVIGDGERVATEIESEAAIRSLYEGPTKRRNTVSISALRESLMEYEAQGIDGGFEFKLLLHRLAEARLVPTWDLVPRMLNKASPPRIEHVLIDERQDCTWSESILVERIADHVYAVGDERQAIMTWRGAGGTPRWCATECSLTRTFRFGEAIATVANHIAAQFGGAPIVPGDVEDTVCDPSESVILDALASGQSVAVLCRTHHDCERAIFDLGDLPAVHIKRDPLDALAQDADKIGDAIAAKKVVVSTVHAAKGREFDIVLVDDSVFAACSDRSTRAVTAEDHRVAYVAVTRARRVLMMHAQSQASAMALDSEGIPL